MNLKYKVGDVLWTIGRTIAGDWYVKSCFKVLSVTFENNRVNYHGFCDDFGALGTSFNSNSFETLEDAEKEYKKRNR